MTFGATFGRVISPTFQPSSLAGGGAWWLAGGIAAANCVVAYQPKGAADYAASKVNLANPGTLNAADGAAYPSFATATGWTFDNSKSQYLDSGLTGDALDANNDGKVSAIIRYAGVTQDVAKDHYLFGAQNVYGNFSILTGINNAYTRTYFSNMSARYDHTADSTGAHVLAIADRTGYIDGTSVCTIGDISSYKTQQPANIAIGAANNNGTIINHLKGSIYAVAFYKIVLTEAQVIALTTAMNAL